MDGSFELGHCHRSCPFRPPCWRWGRARLIREHGLPFSRRRDDQWIVQARRFQDLLARATTEAARDQLAGVMPALSGAYHVWALGEHPWRWALEARLLTGEPPEAIAARSGLDGAVVEAYEALFFDVRGHLRATDYILMIAIGPALYRGIHPGDLGTLWRFLAYRGGPVVLEHLIALGAGPASEAPARPDQVEPSLARAPRALLVVRCLIAALTIPVNEKTQLPLIRLWAQLERAERGGRGRSRRGDPAGADPTENMGAMVENLDRIFGGGPAGFDVPAAGPAPGRRGAADGRGGTARPAAGDPEPASPPGPILRFARPETDRGRTEPPLAASSPRRR